MSEGRRQRVKERALNEGVESFADHEFLEFLLFPFVPRKDTTPIAKELLKKFSRLDLIFTASYEALVSVPGMTKAAAEYFSLYKGIENKILFAKRNADKISFGELENAKTFFQERLAILGTEELHIAYLDGQLELIKDLKISEGTAVSVKLDLRKIMSAAVDLKAAFVVIAHNHPSGDVCPSAVDKETTKLVYRLLAPLGIEVIDHIIVGDENVYSMFENGEMEEYKKDVKNEFYKSRS